jgi:hypothetical protein
VAVLAVAVSSSRTAAGMAVLSSAAAVTALAAVGVTGPKSEERSWVSAQSKAEERREILQERSGSCLGRWWKSSRLSKERFALRRDRPGTP